MTSYNPFDDPVTNAVSRELQLEGYALDLIGYAAHHWTDAPPEWRKLLEVFIRESKVSQEVDLLESIETLLQISGGSREGWADRLIEFREQFHEAHTRGEPLPTFEETFRDVLEFVQQEQKRIAGEGEGE